MRPLLLPSFRTPRARRTRCNEAAGLVVVGMVVAMVVVATVGDWGAVARAAGSVAATAAVVTEAVMVAAMAAEGWEAR
jgi:hypothetical protein